MYLSPLLICGFPQSRVNTLHIGIFPSVPKPLIYLNNICITKDKHKMLDYMAEK